MSLIERQRLVNHPHMFWGDEATQKADFLKEAQPGKLFSGTTSQLVALVLEQLDKGHILQATMVQTGHHDDGPRGHAGGNGMDYWPLATPKQSDWLDASDPRFAQLLEDVGHSQWTFQEGMTGDGSDSAENFHYAEKGFICKGAYAPGVSVFEDGGGAHLHMGANGF